MRKQGRHKYFALANEQVAALLESLMGMTAADEPIRILTGPRDAAMRDARVCYNHLAGNKGIQIYDSLLSQRILRETGGDVSLTKKGERFMQDFGVNMDSLLSSRTPVCRPCLDWSERRSHLAGSLGRALFVRLEELKWLKRVSGSRIVKFNSKRLQAFNQHFSSGN